MRSQAVVLVSIIGFALLAGLGLWWLHAETPAPQAVAPPRASTVDAGVPAPPPSPVPSPRPAPATPAPTRAPAPVTRAPELNDLNEKPVPPKMTPLRPDWQSQHLHFAHDAPTALEAVRPLVSECFHDEAQRLRAGDQVILSFSTAQNGHLQDRKVESSSVQDPYLDACLKDAMQDASTTAGAEGPTRFVFKLQPDGGVEAGPAPSR